jgi:hypothetical protein
MKIIKTSVSWLEFFQPRSEGLSSKILFPYMNVVETLKSVVEVVQKSNDVDLITKVLSAQSEAMSLLEDNRMLKERNYFLEKSLKINDDLIFENNTFWLKSDKSGPYCHRCWGVDKNLVRLLSPYDDGYYSCYVITCEVKNIPVNPKSKPEFQGVAGIF